MDEGTGRHQRQRRFSMNGGRAEYNNWELDGGDNMDNGSNGTLNVYPSIDAIAEFKVLTSNYGAQYGRNGSGTVEVETKGGTKAFHGDAVRVCAQRHERAELLQQRGRGGTGVAPEYKKNDFGYTIGGPVYIPGVYNKNKEKTFFFWSQEWRKDIVPGQTFASIPVPSVAERGGDFTDICSLGTTDCPSGVPNNISGLPQYTAAEATAQALFNEIPAPNGPGASTCIPGSPTNPCTFTLSPAQATDWREELIHVDHNFSDKLRATFRFIHDSWQTTTATPLWTNIGSFPTIETAFKGPGVGLVFRLTATASPTLLNEFVFSYTADHILLTDVGLNGNNNTWQRPSGFSTGFTDLYPGNGGGVLPGLNLVDPAGSYGGGFGEDSGYIPNGIYNSNPSYTYRDNVTKTVGRHNLQFGAYIAAAQKNEYGGELAAGSYPGYLTFDPSKATTTTGNPVADMELGYIYTFGQQDHLVKYYNRYKLVEPYFQDDWRVTSRLTLNLGLRLSMFETYREKEHQAFNFDPARYVAGQTSVNQDDTVNFLTADGLPPSVTDLPNGIVQCGVTSGIPVGCMKNHLFNPAPRIGFAWDPWGNGKWAIRGGYGVFFEHTNGNEANTESLENSPPLAQAVTQTNVVGYTSIGGSTSGAQFPLSVVSVPNKVTWPYMQQWHFDIQHDIANNTIATISYVGSKGTHLTRQSDLNQLYPTPIGSDPYKVGEAITPNPNGNSPDCGTNFDAYGVPTNGMTPSGVAVPYATNSAGVPVGPAVNLGVAACGTIADPLRPYPGYGTINHLELESSSSYNALQASLRRTVGQVTFSAAYTYSHSIDDSSDRGDGSLVNAYDFASNRGSSTFDERHILNISYVWDMPFFKGRGLAHAFLGGWETSGLLGISSGTPFSVLNPTDSAGVAAGVGSGSRADIIGDPKTGFSRTPAQGLGPLWYNPAAYAVPQGLTFGDSGRDSLVNPRRTNVDMGLFKHFPIHESFAAEFRAEGFNVFNHTEWNGLASSTLAASNLFYVGAVHNPRILQLALKFFF